MPAPTWALDLRGVRATAHRLYCSCQESPSSFKTLARPVRVLRNRLEEADEALDETSARPEDIAVLQAAGECRDVLDKLERALSTSHYGVDGTIEQDQKKTIAYLLNDINEVSHRLSDALEVLEYLDGNNDLSLHAISQSSAFTNTPRSPSLLTSSSDDGNRMSTTPSSWSIDSRHASLSQRPSANKEPAAACNAAKGIHIQKDISNTNIIKQQGCLDDSKTSPTFKPYRWAMQEGFFDPMSIDIDSASSLITAEQPEFGKKYASDAETRTTTSELLDGTPGSPVLSKRILSLARSRDIGNGASVDRSISLRGTTLAAASTRPSSLSSSASLRLSSRIQASTQMKTGKQADDQNYRLCPPFDEGDTAREPSDLMISMRNVSPPHDAPQLRGSAFSTSDQSHVVVLGRSEPHRMPFTSSSTELAKSRYRIVNPSQAQVGLAKTSSFSFLANCSLHSSPEPQRQSRRTLPAEPYSPPSTDATSPAAEDMLSSVQYELDTSTDVNPKIADTIVASWNTSNWDQAKHSIELLLAHQSQQRSSPLVRRLHHLLGAIHSLKGELDQALKQFLAVFTVPVEEVFQLDSGHCAAAYWMADIYTLLIRRTEALLAYSIAAKNPLLQDSRWLPMQQQILTEREACRAGDLNTGLLNIVGWDDEEEQQTDSGASKLDSILNRKFVARDVAKALTQFDLQPTNRKLDPNRSRAMAFHDLGLSSESWQDKHALHLDAAALEPSSAAWPLSCDPLFALENVRQHRLLLETDVDLLQCGLSAKKILKKSRVSFSCPDLRWLIQTLRKCLTKLNMEWSEVLIENSPKFVARYTAIEDGNGVASMRFLTLPIYRLSFRPGYGVEICPDGICSSRLHNIDPKVEKGVAQEEVKRVKKAIKEFLEMAAKRHEALESRDMALPVMSINGVTSLHRK